jgi:HAMP domain-containing protein
MFEKIKNLGLKWKFGVVVLIVLVIVISIPLYLLQGSFTRKLDVLYGAPDLKGLFVAELLANDIKPLIEQNVDSPEVQQNLEQTVNTYYKSVYGMYSVRYIFIQDGAGFVIADTFQDTVPQWLVEKNPLTGKKHCEPWKSSKDERVYFDCAVPLNFPKGGIGAVRAGILQQNPQSPILEKLKTEHLKGVFRPIVVFSVLLVIMVTVVLTLAFWYFVIRRIRFLSEATERMSFGDLETVVPIKSQDEIGTLEDTLERMRMNLKDAIERLKRRK